MSSITQMQAESELIFVEPDDFWGTSSSWFLWQASCLVILLPSQTWELKLKLLMIYEEKFAVQMFLGFHNARWQGEECYQKQTIFHIGCRHYAHIIEMKEQKCS